MSLNNNINNTNQIEEKLNLILKKLNSQDEKINDLKSNIIIINNLSEKILSQTKEENLLVIIRKGILNVVSALEKFNIKLSNNILSKIGKTEQHIIDENTSLNKDLNEQIAKILKYEIEILKKIN